MADLAAALKGAEEALASEESDVIVLQAQHEAALRSLLAAAREAEAALAEERERRERAENEQKSTHRLLTRFGVPEQIPPFKTPLAQLWARVQMALLERDAARESLEIERKKEVPNA